MTRKAGVNSAKFRGFKVVNTRCRAAIAAIPIAQCVVVSAVVTVTISQVLSCRCMARVRILAGVPCRATIVPERTRSRRLPAGHSTAVSSVPVTRRDVVAAIYIAVVVPEPVLKLNSANSRCVVRHLFVQALPFSIGAAKKLAVLAGRFTAIATVPVAEANIVARRNGIAEPIPKLVGVGYTAGTTEVGIRLRIQTSVVQDPALCDCVWVVPCQACIFAAISTVPIALFGVVRAHHVALAITQPSRVGHMAGNDGSLGTAKLRVETLKWCVALIHALGARFHTAVSSVPPAVVGVQCGLPWLFTRVAAPITNPRYITEALRGRHGAFGRHISCCLLNSCVASDVDERSDWLHAEHQQTHDGDVAKDATLSSATATSSPHGATGRSVLCAHAHPTQQQYFFCGSVALPRAKLLRRHANCR